MFNDCIKIFCWWRIVEVLKKIQLFTETSYLLMNFITYWLSKPASTVVPMVLLEMNHKMYRDCVYYRIKRIFAGVSILNTVCVH
jgi:hypothetical protein